MSDNVDEIKTYVTARLRAACDQVPPKRETSKQKHLSVWTTRASRKSIGVELGHSDRVNLWVVSTHFALTLPASVDLTKKVWVGDGWKDPVPVGGKKNDGANSNIKPFEVFNRRPITRLGIKSLEDARAILDQLLS